MYVPRFPLIGDLDDAYGAVSDRRGEHLTQLGDVSWPVESCEMGQCLRRAGQLIVPAELAEQMVNEFGQVVDVVA